MYKPAAVKFTLLCWLASVCAVMAIGDAPMSLYRTYFKCPPCDKTARAKCPVPVHCKEIIKEPGICACCFTCARMEGESCGVFTERCGSGLKCQPPFSNNAFNKLMLGEGICTRPREPLYEEDNFIDAF